MCSFLSSPYYTVLSITVSWQSSSILLQDSVVFSLNHYEKKVLQGAVLSKEKLIGKRSGQTERSYKPVKSGTK